MSAIIVASVDAPQESHSARVAEGQAPPDEPTSNTLEEFSNRFLTIFWLCQHAFDSV
jgi:hypothetical protein